MYEYVNKKEIRCKECNKTISTRGLALARHLRDYHNLTFEEAYQKAEQIKKWVKNYQYEKEKEKIKEMEKEQEIIREKIKEIKLMRQQIQEEGLNILPTRAIISDDKENEKLIKLFVEELKITTVKILMDDKKYDNFGLGEIDLGEKEVINENKLIKRIIGKITITDNGEKLKGGEDAWAN